MATQTALALLILAAAVAAAGLARSPPHVDLEPVPDNSYFRVRFHIRNQPYKPLRLLATLNHREQYYLDCCELLSSDNNDYEYATGKKRKRHGDRRLDILNYAVQDPEIEPIAA